MEPTPNFSVIGHRGSPQLAPENTLASFKKAKDLGLNWVELDAQRSASGEWVVFHDDTLERTSKAQGWVELSSYEFLKTLEVGSWFDSKFKTEKIPLLSETFEFLDKNELQANIEIKTSAISKIPAQTLVQSFWAVITEFWPRKKPFPLISSFNLELMISLKEYFEKYSKNHPEEIAGRKLLLGLIVEEYNEEALKLMEENQFFSLHCDYQKINFKEIEALVLKKIPLLLYTVNDKETAKLLLEHGVTAIFSDIPNLIS